MLSNSPGAVILSEIYTPEEILADFDSLTKLEQRAWLGWFAGGLSRVIRYGENPHVFFGKCECQQVDFKEVWQGKFVELGWLTVSEHQRYIAIGMVGQPEAVEYHLQATELGCSVRQAYWDRLDRL